jgi:hypothetical protein
MAILLACDGIGHDSTELVARWTAVDLEGSDPVP